VTRYKIMCLRKEGTTPDRRIERNDKVLGDQAVVRLDEEVANRSVSTTPLKHDTYLQQ
jgi:hypothetical protein